MREEARALGTQLYFESLPDDPALSPNPEIRANNANRLKFYERYGARPIVNTAYETPVTPRHHRPAPTCCSIRSAQTICPAATR